MKKVLFQGILSVGVFFSLWFALSHIDWITLMKVDKVTGKTEEKLGALFLEDFLRAETKIDNLYVLNTVDSIVSKICTANSIKRESIKVHIVRKDYINAFALPDGHLVLYSDLILNSENEAELSGVICHEIAHIEGNHIMHKLIKEVGLSVLISLATGNGGPVVISETAGVLSSSAFDRSLEKEADIKAVDYLIKAKIDPEPFANFLYKLALEEQDGNDFAEWISTHPESKERAVYVLEHSKEKARVFEAVLSSGTWEKLMVELEE